MSATTDATTRDRARKIDRKYGRLALTGFSRRPAIVVGAVLVVVGLTVDSPEYLLNGTTALLLAIAATGLGLAMGLAGEFILGQLFMFAVGAYVTAWLTALENWNFWPAAIIGLIAAVLVGLALSLIGLRTSRFYFALIGFFLVYEISDITEVFTSQTGGTAGLTVPDVPSIFGMQLLGRGMFILAAVVLVVCLGLVGNLRRSPFGMAMRQMRDSPSSLAATGIPVWKVRVAVYAISSGLAGAGGAVYSHLYGYLLPTDFDVNTTVLLFAAVVVGGSTTLLGPMFGVIILYLIPNTVLNVGDWSDLIYGAVVLASVIAFPEGIVPALVRTIHTFRNHLGSRSSALPSRENKTPDAASDADLAELVTLLRALRARNARLSQQHMLSVRAVRKSFGGVAALRLNDEAEIKVQSGEVHVLLGPNGSGKTTLLNVISGMVRMDSGDLELDGRDLRGMSAARIARLGVARSFQSPVLADEVTPLDLLVNALNRIERIGSVHWALDDFRARRTRGRSRDMAGRLADAAGLHEAAREPCAKLTSGQRRIVEVLVALVGEMNLVLLDEPAAGLSERNREELAEVITQMAADGLGFLVIEHDLAFAFGVADTVTVLSNGDLLAQGSPGSVQSDEKVQLVLTGGASA
jgi:branched-chain amino acid transport system permease protein